MRAVLDMQTILQKISGFSPNVFSCELRLPMMKKCFRIVTWCASWSCKYLQQRDWIMPLHGNRVTALTLYPRMICMTPVCGVMQIIHAIATQIGLQCWWGTAASPYENNQEKKIVSHFFFTRECSALWIFNSITDAVLPDLFTRSLNSRIFLLYVFQNSKHPIQFYVNWNIFDSFASMFLFSSKDAIKCVSWLFFLL